MILDAPFPESVSQISNRGRVTGENFPVAETDDPNTAALADDTVTPVANSAFDRCEREVEVLEGELRGCGDELTLVLSDSDDDGVLDRVDRCPQTLSGSESDDLGCSQTEFCRGAVED
jgi:hypothetical protein